MCAVQKDEKPNVILLFFQINVHVAGGEICSKSMELLELKV